MATPREEPYIWVTWLSKLLGGEAHCEWALWFRVHNRYDKRSDEFDLAAWKATHGERVRVRAERLRADGYEVFVEEQNWFKLPGKSAILGGKPDIVAVSTKEALVVDCKTGEPRNSDRLQVLTYMLVLPFVHAACKGRVLSGEVRYTDRAATIPAEHLTEELRNLIRRTIERAAGDMPTQKVPSYGECRFCDIGSVDCPERIDAEPPLTAPTHDLF